MNVWPADFLGPIYLAYGLAFFMLGVVALVLPRRDASLPFATDLWLLAAFGLLHGLLEFVDWARLENPSPVLHGVASLLATLSYLPLLEFGRRVLLCAPVPMRIPPLPLYGAVATSVATFILAAADPVAGLGAGARLFIGVPGALLTGFALFVLPRVGQYAHDETPILRRGLAALAAAFLGYGLLTPFVALPAGSLPDWLPSANDFAAATGLPVQSLRALCAIVASLALIVLVREAGTRRHEDMERILGTVRGVVYRCANDPQWSMIYLSGNVEELFGYPREAFFGRAPVTLGGLIHPEDAPGVWSDVQQALDARRDFDLTYRLRGRDGEERWMVERGRGVYAADGSLRYLEGHISDASALVRANETLRIKDAAIESSINAVALLGMDGRISYVNPAFVRLWRLGSAADALGRLPTEFVESPEAALAVIETLRQQRNWRGEMRARRADGSCMDIQLSAHTVFDSRGRPVCMMGAITDISERIEAQRALEESARRLAQTQAMANLGSWEWDIASGAINWSDELYRIYGLDPADGPLDFERFAQTLHAQDREGVLALIRRAVEEGQPYETEFRIVRPDGTERIIAARGEVRRAADGRPLKMFGMGQDVTQRAELLARLTKIGRNAPGMIYQYQLRADGSACFPYASEGIRGIYGVSPEAVAHDAAAVFAVLHPDDLQAIVDSIERSARTQQTWHLRYRVNHPLKGVIWVEGRASPERLPDGSVLWHGAIFDISAQKQIEAELAQRMDDLRVSEARQRELAALAQREQSRMATLLSGMSIGILFEDRDNRIEYVNPAFRHMWAIGEEVDLIGRPTREVLDHSTHRFARPDHASKHILHVLDTHEISERFEVDLYDGRVLTQLSYPVSDTDGRAIGRLWVYEDVTHERQTAQQLIYLAEHDALTGLYNRHRFQDQLERMISAASRTHARFGLLYFDLDDFKTINDTFGHRAGDTVLVRAAGEVASLVRGGELFARLGGDEFAILVELTRGDEPVQLAERIVHAISAIPFRFRGSNLRLTASIGIALFPEHGDNAEDLVAHADTAMYQAKDSGKNTWAVYDARRNVAEAMLERMTWSSRIAHALSNDGLELHFQGIYHTRDGSLSHLEALVRMKDPAQPDRLIMPGQFIPVAEKNGQILDIDRWVIRQSVAVLAGHPDLAALAVNISGRSFDEPGLPHYIQHHLAHFGVEPRRLIIELTETAAVTEMQDAQRFIEALQQTGCLICLDDFGSGFSTFAYLKYLGAHILKIDGMFVRDLPNNRDNQAFVKAMIDVARGLDKITVAEFVEDAATLEMLRGFGVDMAQGYHLHRPSAQLPPL
ncbi:MAG: EAL domain-containing protein [Pseudomonadota bacterium]